MPHLKILIGLPGSGKSFWATQMAMTCPSCWIISTDRIRAKLYGDEAIQGSWLKVWAEVGRQMCDAVTQIQMGSIQWAIYDATNAARKKRRDVLSLARTAGFNHITGVWFDLPLDLCLERNRHRDRQVPETVIFHMHRQLTDVPPQMNEGFDALDIVSN